MPVDKHIALCMLTRQVTWEPASTWLMGMEWDQRATCSCQMGGFGGGLLLVVGGTLLVVGPLATVFDPQLATYCGSSAEVVH